MFTVVLPTHGSHERIRDILSNLFEAGGQISQVVVLDSSSPGIFATLPSDDRIEYYHLPGMGLFEKLRFSTNIKKDRHTILHPDDEFLNPMALQEARDVIKNHQNGPITLLAYDLFFEVSFLGRIVFFHKKSKAYLSARENMDLPHPQQVLNALTPYYQMVWTVHNTGAYDDLFGSPLLTGRRFQTLPERLVRIFVALHTRIETISQPLFLRHNRRTTGDALFIIPLYDEYVKGNREIEQEFKEIDTLLNFRGDDSYSIERIVKREVEYRMANRDDVNIMKKLVYAFSKKTSILAADEDYVFVPHDLVGGKAPEPFHQEQKEYLDKYWSQFGHHIIEFSKAI